MSNASSPASWPWVSLSSGQVVEVDEGDADRPAVDPGARRWPSVRRSTRAPWLRVPVNGSRRVASTRAAVWRVEPALGRPEDEHQEQARDERRREGHDDHLAADRLESGEDRLGVAPDADHATDVAVDGDGQELADDGRGPEVARAAPALRRPARWRPGPCRRATPRTVPATGRTSPPSAGSLAAMSVPSGRRSSTRTISPGPSSEASRDSRAATAVGSGGVAGSRSAGRTLALTKARVVAASLPTTSFRVAVEKCAPTSDRLGRRGDADDGQERAEDEEQQVPGGAARTPERAGHVADDRKSPGVAPWAEGPGRARPDRTAPHRTARRRGQPRRRGDGLSCRRSGCSS